MADTMAPMIGYDYNQEGMHSGRQYLTSDAQLGTWIRTRMSTALVQGREAMVTDAGDNAVLHVKDGQVLWAGGADTARFAQDLRSVYFASQRLAQGVSASLAQHRSPAPGLER